MLLVVYPYLAVLLLLRGAADASTITTAPKPPSSTEIADPRTCEFRTINYITDTLPQLCLRSSWGVANGTSVKSAAVAEATAADVGGDVAASEAGQDASTTTAEEPIASAESAEAEAEATDLETGELNEASFLSFEEWKKQTQDKDKAVQGNTNTGNRKTEKKSGEGIQNLESLEEGEMDLDFSGFRSGGREEKEQKESEQQAEESRDLEPKKKDQYRSKDAGITCKERFSYASFDAGATVLKTHSGAKNAKNVLNENKDSYMLSECSAENKFIIIELSEDIWIDTLVLANYEFFSSMIRTFRVSVSDKYPVKMEKWKDIGTHQARNSRDIQAFLIENPQIWARYIRIEFLSHYGNEYYCPLSLVRVHGTRMLESWKETEASNDDDVDEIEGEEEEYVPEAVAEGVQEEVRVTTEVEAQTVIPKPEPAVMVVKEAPITPWEKPTFYNFDWSVASEEEDICLPAEAPIQTTSTSAASAETTKSAPASAQEPSPSPEPAFPYANLTGPIPTPQPAQPNQTSTAEPTLKDASTAASASNVTSSSETPVSSTTPTSTKAQNVTTTPRNKTTSTSSASSSLPTIQESFFKAVSRRLQLLETNSTLSLKYIEEQSKILREAFTKVEKKQLSKTTNFLDTLNSTVLDELRGFRQQYDEIWQSTVISLESQRDESRREILAISTRLNILADEVIFQKRMSIIQSILLLLCLGLVIFSRVSSGTIDFPSFPSRTPTYHQLESPLEGSMPASPDFHRADSGRWLEPGHRRQLSDETAISRSRSREASPPTPISTYSHEGAALTPPSGGDDSHPLPVPTEEDEDLDLEEQEEPHRTPRKRKAFTSHPSSSPPTSSASNAEAPPLPRRSSSRDQENNTHLPSPPPDSPRQNEGLQHTFSIARKPLPALPPR